MHLSLKAKLEVQDQLVPPQSPCHRNEDLDPSKLRKEKWPDVMITANMSLDASRL